MPRVSVIIPTYNCARFLDRTIKSALVQTFKDREIIIVDDGSTDDTKSVLAHYDGLVHYVYQPNRGASAARNLACSKASGELLAYLDADDMWYPEKLEKEVAFLDAHPECGLVHTEISVINEQDEILHHRFNHETQRPIPQGYCLLHLLRRSHIQTLTVVERRTCIDRVGNFDETLPIAQDYMHWILIALEGMAVGYLPEPLGMYRWRKASLMTNQRRLCEDYEQIYQVLLKKKCVGLRFGHEAVKVISDQLYTVRRELAYLDRIEGRRGDSLRRALHSLKEWPSRPQLYVDLLKACIPSQIVAKLRPSWKPEV